MITTYSQFNRYSLCYTQPNLRPYDARRPKVFFKEEFLKILQNS